MACAASGLKLLVPEYFAGNDGSCWRIKFPCADSQNRFQKDRVQFSSSVCGVSEVWASELVASWPCSKIPERASRNKKKAGRNYLSFGMLLRNVNAVRTCPRRFTEVLFVCNQMARRPSWFSISRDNRAMEDPKKPEPKASDDYEKKPEQEKNLDRDGGDRQPTDQKQDSSK